MSLVFAEEVLQVLLYKSLTATSILTNGNLNLLLLRRETRVVFTSHRGDTIKPAKLPKSHSALKVAHRKGRRLQHQVSDESWNKHLPKAMLLPIS